MTTPEWSYAPQGWKTPGIRGWDVESVLRTQEAKWDTFRRLIRDPMPLAYNFEGPISYPPKLTDTNYAAHNTVMSFAYVLTLAAKDTKVTLLDWGGGVGHYYALARELFPKLELYYHCRDYTPICELGERLHAGNLDVHFHKNSTWCEGRYDLVMASSSLQYFEDWKPIMARLTECSRKYVFITRLPVIWKNPSYVCIQRPTQGYDTEYLGWVFNRNEFLDHAASLRLTLVREFTLAHGPDIANAPECPEIVGFLFEV